MKEQKVEDPEQVALKTTPKPEVYDHYKRPPNLEIAKKHGEATKYGENRITQGEIEKCPCCGYPTLVDGLELCCSRKDFYYNGPGVALYFDFILYCIFILSVQGLINLNYHQYRSSKNYAGNRFYLNNPYPQPQYYYNQNFYNRLALSNRTDSSDLIGQILNFIVTVLILIFTLYYRKMIKKISSDIDQSVVTVSDYSIMVSNLPFDAEEEEIKKFFNRNTTNSNGRTELKKINLGYDIAPYLTIQAELQKKQNIFTNLIIKEEKDKTEEELIEKLKEEMADLQKQLDDMEKDTSVFKFSGVCFITYATQDQSDDIRVFYRATQFQIMFRRIISYFNNDQHRRFRGRLIAVNRAPEPGDILWQSLGISLWAQFFRKIVTLIASVFVLSLCFGIILGVEFGQQTATKQTIHDQRVQTQIGVTIFGFAASFLISCINVVLASVIRYFAAYEKHKTQTEFNISVAKKLGIAQFLNTAIITLIIHLIVSDTTDFLPQLWRKGGLNYDVNLILMTNAVFSWLSMLLNPYYLITLYKRRQIIKQGDKCPLTQKQANIIFEGTQVDLAQKYAQVAKTIMLTFFYAYLLPIGVVFGITSLILQFWVEKVILLRRDQKPQSVSDELAEEMVDFYIEIVMMLFSAGCLLTEFFIFGHIYPLTIAQFVFALIFYILPIEDFLKTCLNSDFANTTETYEQTKHMFWDDFDRRNPLTMDKAVNAWVNRDINQKIENKKRNEIMIKYQNIFDNKQLSQHINAQMAQSNYHAPNQNRQIVPSDNINIQTHQDYHYQPNNMENQPQNQNNYQQNHNNYQQNNPNKPNDFQQNIPNNYQQNNSNNYQQNNNNYQQNNSNNHQQNNNNYQQNDPNNYQQNNNNYQQNGPNNYQQNPTNHQQNNPNNYQQNDPNNYQQNNYQQNNTNDQQQNQYTNQVGQNNPNNNYQQNNPNYQQQNQNMNQAGQNNNNNYQQNQNQYQDGPGNTNNQQQNQYMLRNVNAKDNQTQKTSNNTLHKSDNRVNIQRVDSIDQ